MGNMRRVDVEADQSSPTDCPEAQARRPRRRSAMCHRGIPQCAPSTAPTRSSRRRNDRRRRIVPLPSIAKVPPKMRPPTKPAKASQPRIRQNRFRRACFQPLAFTHFHCCPHHRKSPRCSARTVATSETPAAETDHACPVSIGVDAPGATRRSVRQARPGSSLVRRATLSGDCSSGLHSPTQCQVMLTILSVSSRLVSIYPDILS